MLTGGLSKIHRQVKPELSACQEASNSNCQGLNMVSLGSGIICKCGLGFCCCSFCFGLVLGFFVCLFVCFLGFFSFFFFSFFF